MSNKTIDAAQALDILEQAYAYYTPEDRVIAFGAHPKAPSERTKSVETGTVPYWTAA